MEKCLKHFLGDFEGSGIEAHLRQTLGRAKEEEFHLGSAGCLLLSEGHLMPQKSPVTGGGACVCAVGWVSGGGTG